MIKCRECQTPYPENAFPHLCPKCGGIYGFLTAPQYIPELNDRQAPGIWRYRSTFALPERAPVVSLGEGDTPLNWTRIADREIGFKLESLNPTGSFKDRGSAVLASHLIARGIDQVVEDSSGNAGASFAAYAGRSGILARVFVPSSSTGPKRRQIESYGADIVSIPGPRSKAAEAVMEEVDRGAIYASHAYLPHGIAGIAAIAYELVDQLGSAPGTVIMPVGHGSLLLGVALGFDSLLAAGIISDLPNLVGVQASACAPLYNAFTRGDEDPSVSPEGKTIAGGVSICDPYHGKYVLSAVRKSKGWFTQVNEEEILSGRDFLAEMGIYVEATSGLVYDGLIQSLDKVMDPVICIVTGHGLKDG